MFVRIHVRTCLNLRKSDFREFCTYLFDYRRVPLKFGSDVVRYDNNMQYPILYSWAVARALQGDGTAAAAAVEPRRIYADGRGTGQRRTGETYTWIGGIERYPRESPPQRATAFAPATSHGGPVLPTWRPPKTESVARRRWLRDARKRPADRSRGFNACVRARARAEVFIPHTCRRT